MPSIYLISGCNGAGKSTASFTMFPRILDCKEFVNADNIAAGISPFQPSGVAIEAGRVMLDRIEQLAKSKVNFAIETTLSGRNYFNKVKEWQKQGYEIILIYFWLNSPALAIKRINERVLKGGHSVSEDVVVRRYYRGIKNLFDFYIPHCDSWIVIDNSIQNPLVVAEGKSDIESNIYYEDIWSKIKETYYNEQN